MITKKQMAYQLLCTDCSEILAYSIIPFSNEMQTNAKCHLCMLSYCNMSQLFFQACGSDFETEWHLLLSQDMQNDAPNDSANITYTFRNRTLAIYERLRKKLVANEIEKYNANREQLDNA